jgi:hypothetical protein
MAVQKANVQYTQPQPYNNPAYNKPRPANTNEAPATQNITRFPRKSAATRNPNHQSTDELFNKSYAKTEMQPTTANQNSKTQKANVQYAQPKESRHKTTTSKIIKKGKNKAGRKLGKSFARARVSTANVWITSWAVFWYLTFQLPIAVISVAGLGMAYAVLQLISKITEDGGIFSIFGSFITGVTTKLLAAAKYIFGIEFDPTLLFLIPFLLVFLLGLFQLILTWFMYSTVRINSLSGQAAGAKVTLFIIALVGYAIPILNLFPLIFLWMVVVWIYPK